MAADSPYSRLTTDARAATVNDVKRREGGDYTMTVLCTTLLAAA
jgi:hypothetical protein